MSYTIQQIDLEPAKAYLASIITKNATPKAVNWLKQKLQDITQGGSERELYIAFSMAPRFTGKTKIAISKQDLLKAEMVRPGFCPENWTIDQAVRALIVLSIPHKDVHEFKDALNKLFLTADIDELVALYSCLPLLPYPEEFENRGTEGIRTNMTIVFDAIALNNPFPAEFFGEGAWNQLVLKSLFTSRPLYKIFDLDVRRNAKLAQMVTDYAHERWAAGRVVSPELWRLIAPYTTIENISDLEILFSKDDLLQRIAAALLCFDSAIPEINQLLNGHPYLVKIIQDKNITWDSLGQAWEKVQTP